MLNLAWSFDYRTLIYHAAKAVVIKVHIPSY